MKHFALLCFAVLFLAAGCISYQYEGVREAEPTTHVKVYTDATRIRQPYRVLGQATASGDSQDVSPDRLLAKLETEAEKSGADAILITEQQVVPGEIQKNGDPQFANSFDYDDSTRSWAQIYRDVDLTYGSVRGTPNDNSTVISYKRILRAEFLKYLDAPATAAEVSQVDGKPAPAESTGK